MTNLGFGNKTSDSAALRAALVAESVRQMRDAWAALVVLLLLILIGLNSWLIFQLWYSGPGCGPAHLAGSC
jgi:hypothetical protein